MASKMPTQMVCCTYVGCKCRRIDLASQLQSHAPGRYCAVPDDRCSMVPDRQFSAYSVESVVGGTGRVHLHLQRRCGLHCHDSFIRRIGTLAGVDRLGRLALVVWPADLDPGSPGLAVNGWPVAASK